MNNFWIRKFTSAGELVTKWGSFGLDDGQFDNPIGIAVAPTVASMLQIWTTTPFRSSQWGSSC